MRRVIAGAVLVLAGVVPLAAAAAAAPTVPTFVQRIAVAKAGPLAYVPARVPFGYRYTGYRYDAAHRILAFRFDDRRYAANGKHRLWFTAEPFGGTLASCADGKQKTLQMDGNKVYSDGGVAWRCVQGAGGRIVKLLASGPNLPDVALGGVAASGKRIAR